MGLVLSLIRGFHKVIKDDRPLTHEQWHACIGMHMCVYAHVCVCMHIYTHTKQTSKSPIRKHEEYPDALDRPSVKLILIESYRAMGTFSRIG